MSHTGNNDHCSVKGTGALTNDSGLIKDSPRGELEQTDGLIRDSPRGELEPTNDPNRDSPCGELARVSSSIKEFRDTE
ncbi:hypothetical protein GEMRC1_001961 [Eukaryota sp. GEM-RC1]